MKYKSYKDEVVTTIDKTVYSDKPLTDKQIETIADLFSAREQYFVAEKDTEWLLNHAFQIGMKTYRDLLKGR